VSGLTCLGKRLERCVRTRLLGSVCALAFVYPFVTTGLVLHPSPAHAQDVSNVLGSQQLEGDEQLLLESDDLVFDNDRGVVIARGNVQIGFGELSLIANEVEYDQRSGRLIAKGNVEIIEPNGNRIFAQEIDVTDDFRDGFISALNVTTPEQVRIAAESADRRDGQVTAFNNGVYTACKPCRDNPEKPPFWQIRAKKVVINNRTKTVEYEDASFEFFGRPVARLRRFSHADPSIKRKSGFLFPQTSESEELGFGTRIGYFFNLAPSYDLTAYGTYYTEQGFLGELEWRQRLANGSYTVRYAGIDQQESDEFTANTVDAVEDNRNAVMTSGLFDINERWQVGWNALFQTDNNFARTYELEGYDDRDIVNELYLTGIGEKNYFDLRAQDFLVQSRTLDFNSFIPGDQNFDDQQATVLPVLDYNVVSGDEFQTGQISLDVNVTSVDRDTFQIVNFSDPDAGVGIASLLTPSVADDERFTGLEGQTTRASAELEWKGSNITSGGIVLTGSASIRGDVISRNNDNLGTELNPLTSNDTLYRAMPAGMLELRYPQIAQTGETVHIFEPIAQIIVRPDEEEIGEFANEDAQSLVFDTSNLFRRNKFSGYDRIEGGTRANVGFRYSASFINGSTLTAVAGQSYQIAGENSFETGDLVNVGLESGLESDVSDFVASLQLDTKQGFGAGLAVRLDEDDLDLNRVETSLKYRNEDLRLSARYAFTEAQPLYRFDRDRNEVSSSASVRLTENWRVFGGITYEFEESDIISDKLGLEYLNDCFVFSVAYRNIDDDFSGRAKERRIDFSVGLRTIGNFNRTLDVSSLTGGDSDF